MNAIFRFITALLIGASTLAPANAQLLDFLFPPTTVSGTVGYVQANHFMLVSKDNQYLRIFLKPGEFLPSTIVPGIVIAVGVRETEGQQLYLDRVYGMQGPNGDLVPITAP